MAARAASLVHTWPTLGATHLWAPLAALLHHAGTTASTTSLLHAHATAATTTTHLRTSLAAALHHARTAGATPLVHTRTTLTATHAATPRATHSVHAATLCKQAAGSHNAKDSSDYHLPSGPCAHDASISVQIRRISCV